MAIIITIIIAIVIIIAITPTIIIITIATPLRLHLAFFFMLITSNVHALIQFPLDWLQALILDVLFPNQILEEIVLLQFLRVY